MGVFDGIENFGKVIGDLVGGHGEPSAAPQRPPAREKAIKGALGSPILDAGQLLIAGMRLTTGWGDPEQGEPFGQGAARFTAAGETLGSAFPSDDWQGSGAEAYATANRRQAGHTASMAVLDRSVQTVIAREAFQVAYHRDKLDDQSNYLGDLSYATWSIALIPGVGKAMKAAFELAAVKAALSVCSVELYQLSSEVGENVAQLHELAGEYSTLNQEKPAAPHLDDGAPQPSPDDSLGPGPTDQRAPGQSAPPRDAGISPSQPLPTSTAAPFPPHFAAPRIPHDGYLADFLIRNKGFTRT